MPTYARVCTLDAIITSKLRMKNIGKSINLIKILKSTLNYLEI